MAPPAGYEKPPQFEISDLKLQPSDPLWPDAVRLVQTYWKQATVLAPGQCRQYLEFFDRLNLGTLKKLNISDWWHRLHDKNGNLLFPRLTWSCYLKIATLHDNLPEDYKTAIKTIHGRSVIEDFTESYRRIYPAPKETDAVIKAASASQQTNSTSGQENISNIAPSCNQHQIATPTQTKTQGISVAANQKQNASTPQKNSPIIPTSTGIQQQSLATKEKEGSKEQNSTGQKETHTPPQNKAVAPSPSFTEQQNTTAAQKKEDTLPALNLQQDSNSSAGTQLTPTSPKTMQPVESEGWNIGNVVDMLGQVKKKRLSSAPESSPKRVKRNDNELLDEVNQKTTITQKSMDQLRTIVEGQGAKLEEVSTTAELNKQTLSDMRSELRQFMSAVASTLRDIQERLEE
ncbi:hypothetical protein Trihar35433_5686 [Trichoderma harzianum]|nr:hypothetical protein Trihar35433_5686 [Trichoderma harzianum]